MDNNEMNRGNIPQSEPDEDWVNQNAGNGFDNRNTGYEQANQGYGYGQPENSPYGTGGDYGNNGNYGTYGNGAPAYPYLPQGGYEQELEPPMTVGEWLISMLLMMIPCAGIILVFVWAFSGNEKKSKSNYFKAYLIMLGIMLALYLLVIIFLVMIAAIGI